MNMYKRDRERPKKKIIIIILTGDNATGYTS
jgi:hypothetical protein